MKTTILISGFAALCLLVTFAEAPRRHGKDKMNSASTENITFMSVKRATMLPGVVITPKSNNEAVIVPVGTAENFVHQEIEIPEYKVVDAVNLEADEIPTEVIDADYSYLKFDVTDFSTESELTDGEITELPLPESSIPAAAVPEPAINKFEYLAFDVNDYIKNSGKEPTDIGELPLDLEESKTVNPTAPGFALPEFGYLKFDVTKYYQPEQMNARQEFELPEK